MKPNIVVFILLLLMAVRTQAQLSPGKLAAAHAHLEGLSNCTKCHVLGDKVSHDKCLDCHKELKVRVIAGKGYHASSEVKNKECSKCHSDHHGTDFKMIRFEPEKFNHTLTGYKLEGAHSKKKCADCHKPAFIADAKIKQKKTTYLGLSTQCVACHEDVHLKTLSNNCNDCHTQTAFKPATLFNHNNAAYKLLGKHETVACEKCHKVETRNGKRFQVFKGLQYKTCNSCHSDPHDNKFGQNCTECHTVQSFQAVKMLNDFDHSRTNFKLVDKHQTVNCKDCHKGSYTTPLKHKNCSDCHTDYHKQEFKKQNTSPDCAECHSTKGFVGSSYTIEKHQLSSFPLKGAHEATPCFACHKKTERWAFRNIGKQCSDCHTDIHDTYIDRKYYDGKSCENCHTSNAWNSVQFDHATTDFSLTGAHQKQSCRSCHFKPMPDGKTQQVFAGLSGACAECHQDNHNKQFEVSGQTDCAKCHSTNAWAITNFDHNTTSFKLDGKHANVPCIKCHTTVTNVAKPYVLYKLNKSKCEDCH